jgi:hypothetical protein
MINVDVKTQHISIALVGINKSLFNAFVAPMSQNLDSIKLL